MYPLTMAFLIQTFKEILKRELGEAIWLEPLFAASPLWTLVTVECPKIFLY